MIERKLFPGLKADYNIIFHFELYAALHTTETAMGLHYFVWFDAGGQTQTLGAI